MKMLPRVLKSFSCLTTLDRLSRFTCSLLMGGLVTVGTTLGTPEPGLAKPSPTQIPSLSQGRAGGKVILLSPSPLLKMQKNGTLTGHHSHRSHASHASHRSHYSSRY